MKGYAEREVFSIEQQAQLHRATKLVEACPYKLVGTDNVVRCHELARAVGMKLRRQHCDGQFGMVDHTWIWLGHFDPENPWRSGIPHVLDVYVPGALPQVQLVDMSSTALPLNYRRGPFRNDIREHDVTTLLGYMTKSEALP